MDSERGALWVCASPLNLEAKAAAAFRISYKITNETEQKINYISKMFCLLNKSAVSFARRERKGGV